MNTLQIITCSKCRYWVHWIHENKKLSAALAQSLTERTVVTEKKLRDSAETVKGFCYLGDRLNASGGSEAAVTARRIEWVKRKRMR